MKALSLTQPWATLVAIGAKKIETRSWSTKYRGPLAIHAALRFPREAMAMCQRSPVREMLGAFRYYSHRSHAVGSILCVVDLVDCIQITAENAPPEPERSFGNYEPGRFAWHFSDARPLKPIPCKGFHRLWEVPEEVRSLIE